MGHGGRQVLVLVILGLVWPSCTHSRSSDVESFQDSNGLSGGNSNSSSFLWRVESNVPGAFPPSYMLGTIHVPYNRVWGHIPDNAKMAFYNSRHVFFELDLSNPATMSALAACRILPRGQHLSQLLPPNLYSRLRTHLRRIRKDLFPQWITPEQKARGFDADYLFSAITANWERNRPIWVLLMLSSLTKGDVGSRGNMVLDLFLATIAKKHGKRVSAIEEVQEQCGPLNALSLDKVVFALNYTLKLQESQFLLNNTSSLPTARRSPHFTTEDLIRQYKRGNFDPDFFREDTFHMVMFSHEDEADSSISVREQRMFREIDIYFQDHLISARNHRMAARIVDLLKNLPNAYFFAFGAGHFLGKDSIVDLLRRAGYKVDHVGPEEVFDTRVLPSPRRKTFVAGTFDDLSEEEKNRALLQFLQYHQQQEKASETEKFEELLLRNKDSLEEAFPDESAGSSKSTILPNNGQEEKDVEESLRVQYGINRGGKLVFSGPHILVPLVAFSNCLAVLYLVR